MYFVRVTHHDGGEEAVELPEGRNLVGREPGCWIDPLDPALSRRHAILGLDEGGPWLEPLPSRNGTLVNGRTVEGRLGLAPGDEITAGRTRLRLCSGAALPEERRSQATIELGPSPLERPIAVSAAMRAIVDEAERLARAALPVLVEGETGVGKEVLSRFLHARSGRSAGPFVVVNCPALPPGLVESELFGVEAGVATGVTARAGLLEAADGGTLFLDEVGDLPAEAQTKLLRFLQDRSIQRVGARRARTIDVRIVSATNRDLDADVASGAFRRDLFFRLAGARLRIPPLRERPEDALAIAEDALSELSGGALSLSDGARASILAQAWPGNAREVRAAVELACLRVEGSVVEAAVIVPATGAGRSGEATEDRCGRAALALLEDVVSGRKDFWRDVYAPFRTREISRMLLVRFVSEGLERGGGSVQGFARLLGVEDRYRKLVDFLRNNRLGE